MSVRTVGIGTLFLAGIAFGALSLAIARREPAFSFAGELADAGRRRAHCRLGSPRRWPRRLGAATGQRLRPAARRGLVRLVLPRVEQPGHRLRARVCARPRALRGRSAAGRARSARLPRSATLVAARPARARGRVRGCDPGARPGAGPGLRPRGRGVHASARATSSSSRDSPRLYDSLNRIGVQAGLAWSLALVVLLVLRLVRASPALRRLLWPVLVPAAAYLGLVAWTFAASLERGKLGNSPDRARPLARPGCRARRACGWGRVGLAPRAPHPCRGRAPRRRGRRVAGARRPS